MAGLNKKADDHPVDDDCFERSTLTPWRGAW